MPQTPLILVDNVFDTIRLYPTAVLSATSEAEGREAFRVADYRRDRTWWQPVVSIAGNAVSVDHGSGATRAIDSWFVDRGHNLWGKTVRIYYTTDGAAWNLFNTWNVPAAGTVGGSPLSGVAVTEEGALYHIMAAPSTARRGWRFDVQDVWLPIIPGLMVGLKHQLLGYSSIYDEDAGERTSAGETSRAGYRASTITYSWRTCELDLRLIGSTEYDSTIRTLRRLLFELNQPAVVFMDYETHPARGWMYQYDGGTWGMAKNRVYRGGRIRLRELGALLP